jgi:threonyl-tRNA synthetase
LIIGDKEQDSSRVSLRLRNGEDLGLLSVSDFLNRVTPVLLSKSPDIL